MAMSKKDYETIASVINTERSFYTPTGNHANAGKLAAIDVVTFSLAGAFAKANPRFDTKIFYRACGMEVE